MTVTIDRVKTDPSQTDPNQTDQSRTTEGDQSEHAAQQLLDLLNARVGALAFAEPDEFHSGHEAGRELLELAATARRAAACLGASAGTVVTQAAGVVVVRELVAATRTLAAALALTSRR